MPSSVPYSLVLVGLVLTASLAVLGKADDPCPLLNDCQKCVTTKISTPAAGGNNGTCIYELTTTGPKCVSKLEPSQETSAIFYKPESCATIPTTVAPPPSNTSTTTVAPTTPAPSNTTTTTVAPTTAPPSNTTTTTAAPTTAPPSNGTTTTTVSPPTTPPSNSTTTTTAAPTSSPAPSNTTTTPPPPTPKPAPKSGGFSWASFIGGIVFAAALSSLAYLIFRFYKVRLDRNYHTFSNPTF